MSYGFLANYLRNQYNWYMASYLLLMCPIYSTGSCSSFHWVSDMSSGLPPSHVTVSRFTHLGRSTHTPVFLGMSYAFCSTRFACANLTVSLSFQLWFHNQYRVADFSWTCGCVIGTWPLISHHLTSKPRSHFSCHFNGLSYCLCRYYFNCRCHLFCLLKLPAFGFEFAIRPQLLLGLALDLTFSLGLRVGSSILTLHLELTSGLTLASLLKGNGRNLEELHCTLCRTLDLLFEFWLSIRIFPVDNSSAPYFCEFHHSMRLSPGACYWT